MPFWSTDTIKMLSEIAVSAVREPQIVNFKDEDIITSLEISQGTYGGGGKKRGRPVFTYTNDRTNYYNEWVINKLIEKQNLLLDHLKSEGIEYTAQLGRTTTRITLNKPVTWQELRKTLLHFNAVYP